MWNTLINLDLKYVPKYLLLFVLLSYPFFCFFLYNYSGIHHNPLLGFICLVVMAISLYDIYRSNKTFVMPNYLILYGLFVVYTILSNIFISNIYETSGGLKYFYSNTYLLTFIAFATVENIQFDVKWIRVAYNVLFWILVSAAIVSVIQVSSPLFFFKNDFLEEGLSFNRMADYYRTHANPNDSTGSTKRFLLGYRPSIYSYISGLSVGIDNLAIFSLLIALRTRKRLNTFIMVIAAAIVSFLSSSRWIMLNFLVVVSQFIWVSNNKLYNFFKYSFWLLVLLIVLIPVLQFTGVDVQRFVEDRLLSESASTRILAFQVFSKVYFDNPIFGTGGVDTSEMTVLLAGRSSQIHVGYLKLFYYYGLIGGLLFLLSVAALLKRMWNRAKRSNYWGGFFAFFAFSIANLTLFELDLYYFGLLLAIIFSNHIYNNREELTVR